jgi:hypothetical protein
LRICSAGLCKLRKFVPRTEIPDPHKVLWDCQTKLAPTGITTARTQRGRVGAADEKEACLLEQKPSWYQAINEKLATETAG